MESLTYHVLIHTPLRSKVSSSVSSASDGSPFLTCQYPQRTPHTARTRTRTHTHTHMLKHTHAELHTHMHTHTCLNTHTCFNTHIKKRTHTHTHTHTQTHMPKPHTHA